MICSNKREDEHLSMESNASRILVLRENPQRQAWSERRRKERSGELIRRRVDEIVNPVAGEESPEDDNRFGNLLQQDQRVDSIHGEM